MPRTKVVKKNPPRRTNPHIHNILSTFEQNCTLMQRSLEEHHGEFMRKLRIDLTLSKLSIPSILLSKILVELRQQPLNWSGNNTTQSIELLETTKTLTLTKSKRQRTRRSSTGDEGYDTTGSTNGTSGGRRSRLRDRTSKIDRESRSLSTRQRTTKQYKTPASRAPPATYATVTPKVKPNTPQVLLRRPKMGEVALSLQGSPLMTGNVMTDNFANINIPLEDGRLLTIQPQRGLRMSQIPDLDHETKRQLETLRDNLNKVCSISARK